MISPSNNCYGCRACEQVCPVNAIAMVANDEGFLFPLIDMDKCVQCQLCIKVCPEYVKNVQTVLNPISSEVYAAWNRDKDLVLASTSGGLSATIASYVIKTGGIVYGCAWQADDLLIAMQTRIETEEQLHRIKGSKYVQSDTNTTYKQVKADLQTGVKVLYTGTPCQIAGLKLFLRKEYENLITIDLVCHGVPSPKIFEEYIGWLRKKSKEDVTNYKFRNQSSNGTIFHSWSNQYNRERKVLLGLVSYSIGFYRNYFNRESCFNCAFSQSCRVGDITLSDFWGGENFHAELRKSRRFGYNLVLCNTKKGGEILSFVQDQIDLVPSKLEYAVKGDIRLREPDPRPKFRDIAYKILDEHGFDYLQRNFLRPKYYYIKRLIPAWARAIINTLK